MATVIDSLIVKLGIDAKDFQAGEKKVVDGLEKTRKKTERIGKDLNASGKDAAEFFGQIQRAAVKFFAVLTVGRGMADFTRLVVQGGAGLDRMATRLGESASSLSRWQGAVRQSGGSAEGFLATVQGLSQQFTLLKETGDAPIRMLLNQLGVSAADATGKAKPMLTLLADIGDALEGKGWANSDKFNKLINAGIDEGTANLLLKGQRERNRLLSEQVEYSEADARAAREASEKWEEAKLRIERTSQTLVIALLPLLEKFATGAADFVQAIVPALEQAVEWFVDLDKATDGWASTLAIALATLRLITGPAMIAGVGSLAATFGRFGALGAAGAGGYLAGGYINDKFITGTKAGDMIGEGVARVLAFFGNDEAARAIAMNNGETAPQPSSRPSGGSRAERNFNPGNLEFRGQRGATPEEGSGRFAKFGSAAEGVAALVRQLKLYESRGLDTLDEIVNTYAPSSENDTRAYINQLSKALGVSGSQELDMSNPDTMAALVRGISRHESGSNWLSDEDVMTGIQMAGIGRQPASNNMTIGEIKVYSQATDAAGIARDLNSALIRQADMGMR